MLSAEAAQRWWDEREADPKGFQVQTMTIQGHVHMKVPAHIYANDVQGQRRSNIIEGVKATIKEPTEEQMAKAVARAMTGLQKFRDADFDKEAIGNDLSRQGAAAFGDVASTFQDISQLQPVQEQDDDDNDDDCTGDDAEDKGDGKEDGPDGPKPKAEVWLGKAKWLVKKEHELQALVDDAHKKLTDEHTKMQNL